MSSSRRRQASLRPIVIVSHSANLPVDHKPSSIQFSNLLSTTLAPKFWKGKNRWKWRQSVTKRVLHSTCQSIVDELMTWFLFAISCNVPIKINVSRIQSKHVTNSIISSSSRIISFNLFDVEFRRAWQERVSRGWTRAPAELPFHMQISRRHHRLICIGKPTGLNGFGKKSLAYQLPTAIYIGSLYIGASYADPVRIYIDGLK